MALSSTELKDYLKLAASVQDLPKHDFYLSYDAAADVPYVNFHSLAQPAYDSELTDEGAIVRYDAAGEVIGITILDVSDRHA